MLCRSPSAQQVFTMKNEKCTGVITGIAKSQKDQRYGFAGVNWAFAIRFLNIIQGFVGLCVLLAVEVCMCVCMYVFMYVRTYVCMFAYACACIHIPKERVSMFLTKR